jgi:hypothetical protein
MVGPGTPYATIEDKWNKDFTSKIRQIVAYRYGKIQMYVHEDTLKNPEPNGHMKFHQFTCFDPNSKEGGADGFTSLIDTRIFNGELTEKVNFAIGLVGKMSSELSESLAYVRPTLKQELVDLNTLFYDKDENRMNRIKVLTEFFAYPGDDEESFFVYEWELQGSICDSVSDQIQEVGIKALQDHPSI